MACSKEIMDLLEEMIRACVELLDEPSYAPIITPCYDWEDDDSIHATFLVANVSPGNVRVECVYSKDGEEFSITVTLTNSTQRMFRCYLSDQDIVVEQLTTT